MDQAFSRWNNRASAVYNYIKISERSERSDDSVGELVLADRLSYRTPKMKAVLINKLIVAKDHDTLLLSFQEIDSGRIQVNEKQADWSFLSTGDIDYLHGKSYSAGIGYAFATNDEQGQMWRVAQNMHYNIFTKTGIIRRIASFYQEFLYEGFSSNNLNRQATVVEAGGRYYPNMYWSLGGYMMDTYYFNDNFHQYTGSVFSELDFKKLKIGVNYTYGLTDNDFWNKQLTEHRWEIRIKKFI